MDALTFQQTQTSNFSHDSDAESNTSYMRQCEELVQEFQAAQYQRETGNIGSEYEKRIDPSTTDNKGSDIEASFSPSVSPVVTHGEDMRDTSLKIPSLGQLDTTEETASVDNMSIDTADRYQVQFVASGTTPEPFEYIPWKIQLDEGNGIHCTLHKELTSVMGVKASTKEVFSPFHNRSYQEIDSYLGENNFFFDSLDRIARVPRESIVENEKALQFMAYFLHDFIMDYGENCLKHQLLHQGNEEKHLPRTIRRWFSGEDNGQIAGMIDFLKNDISCNKVDEHTELCLEETSSYPFQYNQVRKTMSDLCNAYETRIALFGVEPVALRLLDESKEGKGKEDLLSIFYFACHHYSIFGEEFNRLLQKRHTLIPQLLSERFGKMTVVQLLVFDGDHVHPNAKKALKFPEGVYISHYFCPFLLHPMLEEKKYVEVERHYEKGKVWKARHVRMSAHSCEVMYWHYCYFKYKDLHPTLEIDDFDFDVSNTSDESDTEESSSHATKRGFCCNLKEVLDREKSEYGYNRVYLTCYGDATGGELTYYGEEKLYVMEYNSHCLSIFDKDGEVEDLREYRAKDLDFQEAKNIYKK